VVRKGRCLKFAVDGLDIELFFNSTGVGVNEANPFVAGDAFCQLWGQLEDEQQIGWLSFGIEAFFRRRRGAPAKPFCQQVEDMPGNAVILSVGVAIAQNQSFAQHDRLIIPG
jgi:hypothetical protein